MGFSSGPPSTSNIQIGRICPLLVFSISSYLESKENHDRLQIQAHLLTLIQIQLSHESGCVNLEIQKVVMVVRDDHIELLLDFQFGFCNF
ncbi:unnamed protein product [Rhizophagus irregularis]|uniref:Uncharacterized protein n=1 Tax=Rhizophagus irregularis TaxID=588596 RepID=A0A915ZYI0_9GLOM|nr:unnamed protein product [Rhizophagus irregularis]CAB5393705.1 unnamed protein product [Rhizophagus irregularis]CAB5393719.1 unnamed protein product [Rhizophagus irregularis]